MLGLFLSPFDTQSDCTVGLPGCTQPIVYPSSNVTLSIDNTNINESHCAGNTGDHNRPTQHSQPTTAGTNIWWERDRTATYGSTSSDTLLASSRSESGSAFNPRPPAPTGWSTVGRASPKAASDDPDEEKDNVISGLLVILKESSRSEIFCILAPKTFEPFPWLVYLRPHRRPIPLEHIEKSKEAPVINEKLRLTILHRYWHSSAVTLRTKESFLILARQWTPAVKAKAKVEAAARITAEDTARTTARNTATNGAPVPALKKWPPPKKSCIVKFMRGFAKYQIRKNYVDPNPQPELKPNQRILSAAYQTWLSSSKSGYRWLQVYTAWEASQEDSGQPVLPPRARNNGSPRSSSITLTGLDRPTTTGILRGGAGTPESLDDEALEEDEPANAPGNSPIYDPENNPLAEDILNESENGFRIDDREEYVLDGPGDDSRNDAHVGSAPHGYPGEDVPANESGNESETEDFRLYLPGSPQSKHSVLSGYTTDLSRAASSAFRGQNVKATEEEEEEEEAINATLERAAAALGQPSNGSEIPLSGESNDIFSCRRFSFETRPSSGSRSKHTSSKLNDIMDWIPSSPLPRSGHTSSNLYDAMGEDDYLINPRLGPAPPANNVPGGVSPLGFTYNETANIQPVVPPTRLRRRDLFRHAPRREQLRDQLRQHLLRAFRSMLVMGSTEMKLIRKGKK